MLDSGAQKAPGGTLNRLVPPVSEVARAACDAAAEGADVGGDSAASTSELSTCVLSSPKTIAEVDESRACGVASTGALNSGRGQRNSPRPSGPASSSGNRPKREDLAVAVLRNIRLMMERQERMRAAKAGSEEAQASAQRFDLLMGRRRSSRGNNLDIEALQKLQVQEAHGQMTTDGTGSTQSSGELIPAERLHAARQCLTESEANLAKERRLVAESRELANSESQAARQLRQELDAAKRELELKGQEAERQLREELAAARRELEEQQRLQAASSGDEVGKLRSELEAARRELEGRREQAECEVSLRAEVAAAQCAEKAEAQMAVLAEAARDKADAQSEILRVQYHVAEADLMRVKAELAEALNRHATFEEEMRGLRARQAASMGAAQGGNSLLARHELANRPMDSTGLCPSQMREASGGGQKTPYWLSCCSSMEMQSKASLATENALLPLP